MKKIISVFLSAAVIFLTCISGFAGYENTSEYLEAAEESESIQNEGPETGDPETEDPEEDENAYHVRPAQKANSTARIYLCSKLNFPGVGHIFIYVENLTDEPIKVGQIVLEKDQAVSMGSFGFQRSDGWGVYYNTESYLYGKEDYSSLVCMSEEIDSAHLAKLNKFLEGYNFWELFINCVFFAVGAWNSCTNTFILPISFPVFCRTQINAHKNDKITQMYIPERDNVYHVKGTGARQSLVVCSNKSLKKNNRI